MSEREVVYDVRWIDGSVSNDRTVCKSLVIAANIEEAIAKVKEKFGEVKGFDICEAKRVGENLHSRVVDRLYEADPNPILSY